MFSLLVCGGTNHSSVSVRNQLKRRETTHPNGVWQNVGTIGLLQGLNYVFSGRHTSLNIWNNHIKHVDKYLMYYDIET